MLNLKILNGPLKDKVFPISKDEIYIGREDGNHIQIKDTEVEQRHAVFFTLGDMCFIRDLKTQHGTFLNNKRVHEEILDAGDKIKIGSVELKLEEAIAGKNSGRPIQYDEDESGEGGEETPEVVEEAEVAEKGGKGNKSNKYSGETAARHLSSLHSFSEIIADAKEYEHVLQVALKHISDAMAPDNIYIFLKDKHGDLSPKAIFEREKVKIAPVSRGIIRRVLKSNRAVITTDASADTRFRDNLSIVRRKIKAVICAPLTSRQQVMGAIYVGGSSVVQLFTQQDLEFVNGIACLTAIAIDNLRSHRKQSRLLMNMMRSLVTAMELALPETRGHSMRVASYAGAIAQEKAMSPQKTYLCQLGGYLHDVGKVISRSAVKNPEEQKKIYQEHVTAGEKILFEMEGMEDILPAVKYHHEYHDGSGFPEGLKEEHIPIVARIVGLANYFDHLLTDKRPNGNPLELKEALKELKELAGKKFHSDDVMALREACRQGEIKVVALPFVVGTADNK
jgi:putative nucleotidyltransferase with HDIG domain